MRTLNQFRSLSSSLLGITLLAPASYFMLTITARICLGAKSPYYFIAPSFLQSPFNPFELHKAQVIIGSLILAILFNLSAFRGRNRHWLNSAIAFQGILLLLILICYTFIQHLRY
ncbi:MAG TPA: hypothetical protein VFE32_05465 [Puia sp.]|jgi:hypothetical protein|nr:hypothetical protein [Puia sp.]